MVLPYHDNRANVSDNYRGKEIFKCMNEKCGYEWRSNPGWQDSCWKCGHYYMKYENFYADWVLTNNEWKRKENEYS